MSLSAAALDKLFGDRMAADGNRVADNFARWYEGSQLVDASGAPLILYHGTTVWERPDGRQLGNITAFNRRATIEIVRRAAGLDAIGSWFTDEPKRAMDYSSSTGAIYPVFAKLVNPWRPETYDELVDVWVTYQDSELTNEPARALHKRNQCWGDPDRFVAGMMAEGYDGIVIGRGAGRNGSTEFVDQTPHIVFSPSSIKSVCGNSGIFDGESDDIADSHGWDAPTERRVERMRG